MSKDNIPCDKHFVKQPSLTAIRFVTYTSRYKKHTFSPIIYDNNTNITSITSMRNEEQLQKRQQLMDRNKHSQRPNDAAGVSILP